MSKQEIIAGILSNFYKEKNLGTAAATMLKNLFGITCVPSIEGIPLGNYFKQRNFTFQYIEQAQQCISGIYEIGATVDIEYQDISYLDFTQGNYPYFNIYACEIRTDVKFTRRDLAAITRAFNAISSTASYGGTINDEVNAPVIVVFRQGNLLSIASCEHHARIDNTGDKIGKVTVIRDINCEKLHPGHRQILERIADDVQGCTTFDELFLKWMKSFSIDILSDKFFEGYKDIYEDIIEYVTGKRMKKEKGKWVEKNNHAPCLEIMNEFQKFDDPEKTVRDYVKNLMGRLVFIQFLQKKGWMGVPAGDSWIGGDPEFLQHLFATSNKQDSFVDDVLEPLFNDLNTKRYGDLITNQNVGVNKKVPYLNGGLFELTASDDTKFPLPSRFLKKLFDFFDAYNFTIDENAPDDVEIGVDPEMLGRIFENLLEDNKAKGAYYTPKEIVQYMCRESLIAYLTRCVMDKNGDKNPEEVVEKSVRMLVVSPDTIMPRMTSQFKKEFGDYIRKVKICDPAIGSGAFPMGLLNELVRCRVSIGAWATDAYGNLLVDDYAALKAEIICNNIYGVDIEKGAIDIARLRFWLSIIVDEKIPHALPNFDYKFMRGNSLISTFSGEYINLDTKSQSHIKVKEMKMEEKKLSELKQKHYAAQGNDKNELAVEIKKAILRLISMQIGYELRLWYQQNVVQTTLDFENSAPIDFSNIKSHLPLEKKVLVERAETLYKQLNDSTVDISKRAHIDIKFFDWRMMFAEVFDVENGGFDIVIGNPPYIKEYENKDAFDAVRKTPYYKAKMDIWFCFTCVGFDLLKKSGVISFIAQPQWRTSDAASIMRNKICEEGRIRQIVDFGSYMVFDASTQAMIFVLQKERIDCYNFAFKINQAESLSKEDIHAFLKLPCREIPFSKKQYLNKSFAFAIDSSTDEIIKKVENKKNFEFNGKEEIIQGIIGGPDDAFKIEDEDIDEYSEKEKSYIKSFYTSTGRYVTPKSTVKLIYIHDKNVANFNSVDYPIIYAKLDAYREKLNQRREVLMGRKSWFSLWWERDEDFFLEGEKIIFAARTYGRNFTYTSEAFYASRNCFLVKSQRISLKYVVGLLNSKVLDFYMHNKLKMNGDLLQIDKVQFLNIPIYEANAKVITQMESYVDDILRAKKNDINANIDAEERKIDQLVYQLYGLTNGEVKTIDPNEITVGLDTDLFKA